MPVILAIGDPEDLTAAYVRWAAERLGADVIVCDEEQLGIIWDYRIEHGCGVLRWGDRAIPFVSVAGAVVRFSPMPAAPPLGLDSEAEAVLIGERRAGVEWFLDSAPFTVVNRPSSGRSNGSKPLQMRMLEARGLVVPRWTVTNDASVCRAFAATCAGGAVFKSVSGLRSHVRRIDDDLPERIHGATPVVLQEYIAGCDVRVHVVGDRCFGTEVQSAEVDYRFDDEGARFIERPLPSDVHRLCVEATMAEGLVLAGFDFRVTASGDWYCLEVNPVPTFLPYEAATGAPIAQAIVELITQRAQ